MIFTSSVSLQINSLSSSIKCDSSNACSVICPLITIKLNPVLLIQSHFFFITVELSVNHTSVVCSSQIPATPLLNDPFPVVDHFLSQPDYPAQGAARERERESEPGFKRVPL